METKICTICKKELDINLFSNYKRNKDGHKGQCKVCEKQYMKEYGEKRYIREKKKVAELYIVNRVENRAKANERYNNNKKEMNKYSVAYGKTHKEQVAKSGLKYRMKNREKINYYNKTRYDNLSTEFKKQYYEDNKEKMSVRHKRYHEDNKETLKLYNKEWNKINKDKTVIYGQRREAKKKQLPHSLTIEQWENAKVYFNNKCCYCGQELPLEQEHFLALNNGGEYTHNNILPSCKSCNCQKNASDFFKWYPKQKYYTKNREKKILKFLNYKNEIQQLTLTI